MKIDDLSYDSFSIPHLFETCQRDGLQDGEYILRHSSGRPVSIGYNSWVFKAEEWEQLYLAALVETSSVMLRDKMNAAVSAIQKSAVEMY
jgi:hypothetical protein